MFAKEEKALVYLNIQNIQGAMSLVQKGYEEIKGLIMILMIGQPFICFGLNFEVIGITKYYRFMDCRFPAGPGPGAEFLPDPDR